MTITRRRIGRINNPGYYRILADLEEAAKQFLNMDDPIGMTSSLRSRSAKKTMAARIAAKAAGKTYVPSSIRNSKRNLAMQRDYDKGVTRKAICLKYRIGMSSLASIIRKTK